MNEKLCKFTSSTENCERKLWTQQKQFEEKKMNWKKVRIFCSFSLLLVAVDPDSSDDYNDVTECTKQEKYNEIIIEPWANRNAVENKVFIVLRQQSGSVMANNNSNNLVDSWSSISVHRMCARVCVRTYRERVWKNGLRAAKLRLRKKKKQNKMIIEEALIWQCWNMLACLFNNYVDGVARRAQTTCSVFSRALPMPNRLLTLHKHIDKMIRFSRPHAFVRLFAFFQCFRCNFSLFVTLFMYSSL